jgi:hypothetical protein
MSAFRDRWLMADAYSEYEASARDLGNRFRCGAHSQRVTRPYVRDPGGELEAARMAQQIRRMCEWIASATAFGHP